MIIKVLFFAQFAEVLGEPERDLELDDGITAGELAERLRHESGLNLPLSLLKFVVNEEIVDGSWKLKDQDVFAILTPFAGG